MMEPQTDNEIETIEDAIRGLSELSGQTYINADLAFDLLRVFYTSSDHYHIPEKSGEQLPLGEVVFDISEHPKDARGIAFAPEYQMVTTSSKVSQTIAEGIEGVEPGDEHQYAGAGFSADAAHDDTMERLRDHFGVEIDDD